MRPSPAIDVDLGTILLHELKGPATVLLLQSTAILMSSEVDPVPVSLSSARALARASRRLADLVDAVDDLYSSLASRPTDQLVSVGSVAREVAEHF